MVPVPQRTFLGLSGEQRHLALLPPRSPVGASDTRGGDPQEVVVVGDVGSHATQGIVAGGVNWFCIRSYSMERESLSRGGVENTGRTMGGCLHAGAGGWLYPGGAGDGERLCWGAGGSLLVSSFHAGLKSPDSENCTPRNFACMTGWKSERERP